MWNVVRRVVLVILERQLFKLACLLDVVVRAQLVRVEGDKGHREVRVVRHLSNLVDQVDLVLQAVEVGELEFGDCEEVRCLFHRLLELLELGPKVVKLAPVGHEVHLSVELCKEIIELFGEVLQILRLPLELELAVFEPALLASLDAQILVFEVLAALLHLFLNEVEKLVNLLEDETLVLGHLVLVQDRLLDLSHVPVENYVNFVLHAFALLLQCSVFALVFYPLLLF